MKFSKQKEMLKEGNLEHQEVRTNGKSKNMYIGNTFSFYSVFQITLDG